MKLVVQRVLEATVVVEGETVGAIGHGLLVYAGVAAGDGPRQADDLAEKVVGLRIFRDDEGRMNRSLLEVGGAVLLISQFTLLGDVDRGKRPSFVAAAAPQIAEPLLERLAARIVAAGAPLATGRFGADMKVSSVNDGPVTIVIEKTAPETA